MKLQDVIFFLIFIMLFWKRPMWLPIIGIGCFAIAIPLFSQWIFFTAERLTWYGAVYIFVSLLISLREQSKVQ